MRSFADRARGFSEISFPEGTAGRLATLATAGSMPSHLAPPCCSDTIRPSCAANVCFTILSSRLWNDMTASLPSMDSSPIAASSPSWSWSFSQFTAMRSAWNERVAGWRGEPRRPPTAFSTTAASLEVVVIGAFACSATMAFEIVTACGSSPNSCSTLARLRQSPASKSSNSAAVMPPVVSMRMSSGPSAMKLNPRPASSSWNDDTPRSITMPSTFSNPCSTATARIDAKSECIHVKRSPKRASLALQRPTASGSRSSPSRRESGLEASSSASACPPPPTVPSIYFPPGRGARPSIVSFRSTDLCKNFPPC